MESLCIIRHGGRALIGAAASLWLAGCGQEEIRHLPKVPKDPPFSFPQAAGPPHEAPRMEWTVPAGWTDKGASGMRLGSFAIENTNRQSADISVIPVSSWAGKELDNLNRWRAQVGQMPVKAEELAQQSTAVPIGQFQGQLFETSGTPVEEDKKLRILVAVLSMPGTAFIYKMIGDDALVAAEKPSFLAFLQSVRFGQPAGTPAPSAGTGPSAAAGADLGAPPTAAKPAWTVPTGWTEQAPGTLQLARFAVDAKDAGKAEATVTVLAGEGGGALANVNRWRRQIGLPPVEQAGLPGMAASLDVGGTAAMLFDMTADSRKIRTLAAVVPRGNQTWFYKLTGDEAAVGAQKDTFIQFVRSAH